MYHFSKLQKLVTVIAVIVMIILYLASLLIYCCKLDIAINYCKIKASYSLYSVPSSIVEDSVNVGIQRSEILADVANNILSKGAMRKEE